ncbi:MAG: SDR family oxidoreductase [Actinomycetota bacterium]|nr:SDR family oxidoreductase [Actinomycetota bacterium]
MDDGGDMFRLDGRLALVVGAGSGIGAAAAEGLARFGATVVCADAVADAAAGTAGRIIGSGGRAEPLTLDLLDAAAVRDAVEAMDAPNILVTTPAVNVRKRIVDYTDDELDRVVDLNLKGAFRLCQSVGRRMADAGRGSMIGFSSIRAQTTEPGQGAYAATKAATVMLFKTLAAELGPSGVRANTIAPGVVETPLTAPIKADAAWYGAYATKTILKRWAQPSEMVGAVVFLASDASSYVTGTTLFVDGGWTAADGRFDPSV